jgi:hypothetical protein
MTDAELNIIIAERDAANAALLRAKVGTAAGLTAAQAARLQGSDEAEMTADAAALKGLLTPAVDGPQHAHGDAVGGTHGTVTSGAARYRAQHGLDENGNQPEPASPNTLGSPSNPATRTSYQMER